MDAAVHCMSEIPAFVTTYLPVLKDFFLFQYSSTVCLMLSLWHIIVVVSWLHWVFWVLQQSARWPDHGWSSVSLRPPLVPPSGCLLSCFHVGPDGFPPAMAYDGQDAIAPTAHLHWHTLGPLTISAVLLHQLLILSPLPLLLRLLHTLLLRHSQLQKDQLLCVSWDQIKMMFDLKEDSVMYSGNFSCLSRSADITHSLVFGSLLSCCPSLTNMIILAVMLPFLMVWGPDHVSSDNSFQPALFVLTIHTPPTPILMQPPTYTNRHMCWTSVGTQNDATLYKPSLQHTIAISYLAWRKQPLVTLGSPWLSLTSP